MCRIGEIMKKLTVILLSVATLMSHTAFAKAEVAELPIMDNVRVFYQDKSALPYVTNFYTKHTEAQIIDFYQTHLGEVVSQETKRGRLTLTFAKASFHYRVIVSQQNNMRQVDLIVQQ